MTLLTSWLFWVPLMVSLTLVALLGWGMWVVSRMVFNVFLSIPIEADPFRNEEGILQYSVNLQSARDGVSIKCFFIPGKDAKGRTIVFCHEIGAGAASYQKYCQFLLERGFNLLTFDFRGHGLSGNVKDYSPRQWVTQHEVNDLLAVLKYLKTRRDVDPNRIGIFGISKGAAVALVAAAKKKTIKTIVSDGAFSTNYTLVDYMRRWTSIFLPIETLPGALYWLTRVWTLWVISKRTRCHFPSVEKAVSQLHHCCLLFIHGEKDNYIPNRQASRLYARANGPIKELWIVPQARHNEAVVVAPAEYQERVSSFFEKHL